MNLMMTSRRNTIDYSEPRAMSPSQAADEVTDRRKRPRRREQSLANIENERWTLANTAYHVHTMWTSSRP